MQRAPDLFGQAEREKVAAAVRQAESHTSAEIVPVVATASGRYDRAEDIVGLWLGLIFLGITWAFFPASEIEVGAWSETHPAMQLIVFLLVVVIGFIAGAALATQWLFLRWLFTPADEMREEVWQSARTAFFDRRVHHTDGASGILVYVSLYERQAIILADEIVLDKLGQAHLDTLCQGLVEQMKVGHPAKAMCETIEKIGQLLKSELPRADDDVNELSDALVIIE